MNLRIFTIVAMHVKCTDSVVLKVCDFHEYEHYNEHFLGRGRGEVFVNAAERNRSLRELLRGKGKGLFGNPSLWIMNGAFVIPVTI